MNRADLSWAIKAVLPHADRSRVATAVVGLQQRDGSLYVYGTDTYTFGIARIPLETPPHHHGVPGSVPPCKGGTNCDQALPATFLLYEEAVDLERFIRPNKVAEREEHVEILLSRDEGDPHWMKGTELHVAHDTQSTVYPTAERAWSLQTLLGSVDHLWNLTGTTEIVLQPKLLEKFAKAQRADVEKCWIWPTTVGDLHMPAAVVAVGDSFVGGIAGLVLEQDGAEKAISTVQSFLQIKGEEEAA